MDSDKHRMRVIVLANWGLGLEVLKVIGKLSNIEIRLVVTQHKANSSDIWHNVVYEFAFQKGYKTIIQEEIPFSALRDFIIKLNIDLLIVHAFKRLLPKEVYSAPKYRSINIHPSLLPKYRGPSSNYWALKNKENITGLTCHYIDEGMDTGDIIFQTEVKIESNDTIESVIEKQKLTVGKLLVESLLRVVDPKFVPISQQHEFASYAPKPRFIKDI